MRYKFTVFHIFLTVVDLVCVQHETDKNKIVNAGEISALCTCILIHTFKPGIVNVILGIYGLKS